MNLPVHPAPAGHVIPPRRAQVLYFCKAEVAAGNPFPPPIKIAMFMGWNSDKSARDALDKLAYYDKAIGACVVSGRRIYFLKEKEHASR